LSTGNPHQVTQRHFERVVLPGSNLTGPRVIEGRVKETLWALNDPRIQRKCLLQDEDDCGYGITGHLHVSADLTTFLKENTEDGLEEMAGGLARSVTGLTHRIYFCGVE